MKTIYLEIAGAICGLLLVGVVLYGSYQYYYCKPTPIVNNTIVQAGGKVDVKQGTSRSAGHLYTGLYGGRSGGGDELGVEVGWVW